MTPEELARIDVDAQLTASGWLVQTRDKINIFAGRGVAIGELSPIVANVERRLSVVEERVSVVSNNIQCAKCLYQSILQKAFTGMLVSGSRDER